MSESLFQSSVMYTVMFYSDWQTANNRYNYSFNEGKVSFWFSQWNDLLWTTLDAQGHGQIALMGSVEAVLPRQLSSPL